MSQTLSKWLHYNYIYAVYNVRKTQLATISLHHARENNTDLLTLDRITYGYFRFIKIVSSGRLSFTNCPVCLTRCHRDFVNVWYKEAQTIFFKVFFLRTNFWICFSENLSCTVSLCLMIVEITGYLLRVYCSVPLHWLWELKNIYIKMGKIQGLWC